MNPCNPFQTDALAALSRLSSSLEGYEMYQVNKLIHALSAMHLSDSDAISARHRLGVNDMDFALECCAEMFSEGWDIEIESFGDPRSWEVSFYQGINDNRKSHEAEANQLSAAIYAAYIKSRP